MATKRYLAKKIGDEYVLVPAGTEQDLELMVCAAVGGVLAIGGLRRGGLLGTGVALIGAGLLYKGLTGLNPLALLLGEARGGRSGDARLTPSYQHDWSRADQLPADQVEEASMESFPASDAPAT